MLLLDEPASGLDPLASHELSKLLKELANDGSTIIMASHDIFRVREVCNRIDGCPVVKGVCESCEIVKR